MIILIGLVLTFLFGFLVGWAIFNLTTAANLIEELRSLETSDRAQRAKIAAQQQQIQNMTSALTGQQNRQILESMGWRPLAAESHPKDGEQILVAGVETAALAKAPNGAHYAQFKKLGNRQVQLTQGSSGSLRVELDGTVLWIPQRFLLK